MRHVILDTETTGLDPRTGDRIIEIGGVELLNLKPTGRVYQSYLDPERPNSEKSIEITGLTDDMLVGQPKFIDIVDDFLNFIGDDLMVFHNAEFDVKFINAELNRIGRAPLPGSQVIDTLAMAKKKFPGAPASLDALCRRFKVDNTSREKHGALLDSELLAEVYLNLMGGDQPDFIYDPEAEGPALTQASGGQATRGPRLQRPTPLPSRITEAERAAHDAFLSDLPVSAMWRH